MLDPTNELYLRHIKLIQLQQQGIAFPNDFRRDSISKTLHDCYDDKSNEELKSLNVQVSIAGRIITKRIIGKAIFINIQDLHGQIQLYMTKNSLSIDFNHNTLKTLDIGDIIGAKGAIFKTRINILSVYCNEIVILTKAMLPLPDKFHGLNDQEIRYRQRYLDLITNAKTRQTFKMRSLIIMAMRNFMTNQNFIEVETPMMHHIPSGGIARPFVTNFHALKNKMYLRIAPELYLKKLIVGGFEKIFEINRSFRNEGISSCHNPEFTMMELYMAYKNYHDLILLVEDLFYTITQQVLGNHIVHHGENIFDFSKPFIKMTMKEAIYYYNPKIMIDSINEITSATAIANNLNIDVKSHWGLGKLQYKIFEKTVEPNLIQPTFITDYPTEVSPLARRNDCDPLITERFEIFINGYEIGNGFSELNDAEDQKERFIAQIQNEDNYDNEIMHYDEDYITALKHGMPPTAGLGLGLDRIIMLLTNNTSIKDVILFPILKSQKSK